MEQIISKILNQEEGTASIENLKKSILNKIENFLNEHIYPLIFDNDLFPFDKQKQPHMFMYIRSLVSEFEILLSYPWLYEKTKVAFAGKFSSGKSSIINTILGEDILPTDVTPTTSIPTYITFTSQYDADILVVNRYGVVIPFEKYLLTQLRHNNVNEFYGNILQALIDYIVLNKHDELLANLIIIDTPGYNPASAKIDRHLSINVLKESDVIFWVIDINDGEISKDTLNVIKNNELYKKSFYVILNKVDTKPPSVRKKVADKISKTLKKNNIDFKRILLFSSKEDRNNYVKEITDEISKVTERNTCIPLFTELMKILEYLLEQSLEKQKELVKRKERLLEQIDDQIKNKSSELAFNIRYNIIYKNLCSYAKYEEPWFDDNHYKLYRGEQLNKFLKKTTESIKEIILNEYRNLLMNYKGDFPNVKFAIQSYDEKIKDIRRAITELEEIKLYVHDQLRNFMRGEQNEVLAG
ncbi:hypothetical protein JCM9492_13450 [Aquifex pyrophilus]